MIYLDHAATSLHKPQQVFDAVLEAMHACASLGRSGHRAALLAAETAFACRTQAAEFFDCTPEQVAFTFNATHGLNIAIRSLVRPGDRVVVSGFEHNAVMRPLHHLDAEVITAGTELFDPADTLEAFQKAVTSDVRAVICNHVSNVFGYIQPAEKIAELCRKRNIPFILDASQSAGVLPISLRRLGAAFIAMPGHKSLLGPQGTGILLCGQKPEPLFTGGTGSASVHMEMPDFLPDMIEVGTHNVPGIAGLLAGMRYLKSVGLQIVCKQEQDLLFDLHLQLKEISEIRHFYGSPSVQTGVLSFLSKDSDCEIVAQKLADRDFAVRAGLHCAPCAHRSAGTLKEGTVRVSVSHQNTPQDIHKLVEALKEIVQRNNCRSTC